MTSISQRTKRIRKNKNRPKKENLKANEKRIRQNAAALKALAS